MSKLYFKGYSDSRKTPFTSRGHSDMDGMFLFNFTGGSYAVGALTINAHHEGGHVLFHINITDEKGNIRGKIARVLVYPDGTFTKS